MQTINASHDDLLRRYFRGGIILDIPARPYVESISARTICGCKQRLLSHFQMRYYLLPKNTTNVQLPIATSQRVCLLCCSDTPVDLPIELIFARIKHLITSRNVYISRRMKRNEHELCYICAQDASSSEFRTNHDYGEQTLQFLICNFCMITHHSISTREISKALFAYMPLPDDVCRIILLLVHTIPCARAYHPQQTHVATAIIESTYVKVK